MDVDQVISSAIKAAVSSLGQKQELATVLCHWVTDMASGKESPDDVDAAMQRAEVAFGQVHTTAASVAQGDEE